MTVLLLFLKGIISSYRFFVGARTHATIAAYSSCVPTLVAGYSVKARGIAKDLFGQEAGYVVPVQKISTNEALIKDFKGILENEKEIKTRLERIMPDYKQSAKAASKLISDLLS